MDLFIPIIAVQAIYGKENNEGMFFPEDSPPPEPTGNGCARRPDFRHRRTDSASRRPREYRKDPASCNVASLES